MGAFTHWSQPNRGKELQDGTKNLEGNNVQGARGKNRKANNVAEACTKAKGRAAIECVVSIIHSICWHLPPKWLRKIIHNSITLFEIIICFQLFVCQVESVFLASFIWGKLTTPCCFFLVLNLALVETTCCRKDLQEDRSNIAKGTTDPRVEFCLPK